MSDYEAHTDPATAAYWKSVAMERDRLREVNAKLVEALEFYAGSRNLRRSSQIKAAREILAGIWVDNTGVQNIEVVKAGFRALDAQHNALLSAFRRTIDDRHDREGLETGF